MSRSGMMFRAFLLYLVIEVIHGFQYNSLNIYLSSRTGRLYSSSLEESQVDDNINESKKDDRSSPLSRREVLTGATAVAAGLTVTAITSPVEAAESINSAYQPAKRPTAYRVDSTIPPTLLPISTATQQKQVLVNLGRGSGTDKEAVVVDTLNLNNILNKAVFGTINAVSSLTTPNQLSSSGPGYASFVCLGVPSATSSVDVDLALSLLSSTIQARRKSLPTALGLSFLPYSTQPALYEYLNSDSSDSSSSGSSSSSSSSSEEKLILALTEAGVSESTSKLYLPLLRYAKSQSLDLLALSPEIQDIEAVQTQGLQNVNPQRRAQYVVDPEGFIALSSDPRFKLYADRSLLKDYRPTNNNKESGANFFAERILVHEAAASAMAQYAVQRPDALVIMVAPTPDLRFFGGMNGRIPRICQYLINNKNNDVKNKITNNAVTTILLNPTAEETLSKSRFLRLEIGTGPETLQYQTKVADYLWFSSSPKVSLIPRLMDG